MKVALFAIGRMENRYAVEWVEHYKNIGFDKIFIYDNNFGDEEHFEDVLQPYIDSRFVEITDYRDKESCQTKAYVDCYKKHNKDFDWIAFFDFDEFLTLVNYDNIKDYLSQDIFNDYQCINVNWMNYGDNDLVTYDDKPVQERFTEPLPYDSKMKYSFPENYHVKSIIRCGIDNFFWNHNTHTPLGLPIKHCDCDGVECSDRPFKPYNYNSCYIRHYFTKTIDEWMNHKYYRQYADRPHVKLDKKTLIDNFFLLNEITDDKTKYVLDKFGINIKK